MTALRKEIHGFVDSLSEKKLSALKPLLTLLVNDSFSEEPLVFETDLTDEEREIIQKGREEYRKGHFVSLDSVLDS